MKKNKFPHVRVKRGISGLGLFAGEAIPEGMLIIEYVGERISGEEANRRGGKYLFEIDETVTIDGKDRGNLARYVNHSCNPNAESVIIKKRVYIQSIRPIKAGEEITYDYGPEYFAEYLAGGRCRCSASKHLYEKKS